jgi:hypothetical protein
MSWWDLVTGLPRVSGCCGAVFVAVFSVFMDNDRPALCKDLTNEETITYHSSARY